MLRTSLLALFPVALMATSMHSAAGAKEEYELQERCGKRAGERFKQDWGKEGPVSSKEMRGTIRYQSNYNSKLNGCYVAYTYQSYKDSRRSTQITLFEANTNKDIGFFFSFEDGSQPDDCWVGQSKCKSRKEWDALATQYLGS